MVQTKQRHVIDDPNVGVVIVHTYPDGKVKFEIKSGTPMLIKQTYLMGSAGQNLIVELVKPGS
jgi:hypothetical protein